MAVNKRVAILIGPNFHDEEATVPKSFLNERGYQAELVGLTDDTVTGKYGRITLKPDKNINDISVRDYDGLIIPGGGAPERIRVNEKAVEFVKEFWKTGRPVGAICHGPQVLISANVLKGITLTSYIGIRDDIINAGGNFVDQAVCVDGQLISSRTPDDLPVFNETLYKALSQGLLTGNESELGALEALELAVNREKGAQEFYEKAAQIAAAENVKNKFKYLATVEVEHFEQLFDFYFKISGGKEPEIKTQTSEIGKHLITSDFSSNKAIELAVNAEQKAYDFYRYASMKAKHAKIREMFEYLAAEEIEHKRLLLLDKASLEGGQGHFQWATHFDIPPGMDDLW